MKRAIIYARVSTTRQADDGVSIDAQIEQCHKKAAEMGAAPKDPAADAEVEKYLDEIDK